MFSYFSKKFDDKHKTKKGNPTANINSNITSTPKANINSHNINNNTNTHNISSHNINNDPNYGSMRSTNSMKYASNSPLPNPRDIHHSFSIPRNHFNQPTPILLNGNNSEVHQHISRTGTLPRKVYKQSEFDRHDKKKRASFSLPSSPKVAQAPGMRRLENWIGGLINNGKEPIPPNNINGPNVNVVPSNYSNVNNSHWDYTNVQIEKNEPEKQSYTHIGSLPRNFTGNRNVPVSVPSTPQHRANKLLQQLRSDEGNVSESDDQLNGDHHQRLMPTNKPLPPLYPRSNAPNQGIYSGLSMSGVIFLQFNDETKRTLLPHKLSSMDQLKYMFLRAFNHLSSQYLNLPYVKFYIQEGGDKSQIFYELDDIREIKDRCIIKIREQISGYQSPPPIRFTDRAPAVDYMSEGEVDDYPGFTRTGFPKQINTQIRPASAVPGTDGRMYSAGNNTPTNRRDSGSKFDPYYDPYFSDSSSIVGGSQQVPRSATATPVVDREARFRMESMEKQLHGLSSLVHQALVSKNVEGGGQKDMADLRRQILEFNNDNIDMLSTTGSIDQRNFDNCNGSVCSSVGVNENLVGDLKKIRKQIQTYNVDMKHLKKQAQDLKTTNSDSMRDVSERIHVLISNYMKNCNKHEPHTEVYTKHEDDSTDNLRQDHIGQMAMLQNNLSSFERNVENLRKTVVDGNRKLKMIEVEGLTNNLTNIGRTAAKLKTDYPVLYNKIESEIKKNMEKVIRDETFIKEEHQHIDNCLKRCKTLANMMVTMKKLAMVQDPTIAAYTSKLQQGNGTGVSGVFNASKPPMPKPILVNRSDREYSADSEKGDEITIMAEPITVLAPPVPPAPTNYQPPETKTFPSRNNVHVLDSILDELSSTEMDDEPSRIKVQINGKGSTYIPKHRSENTSNNYSTNNDDLKKKQNELDRQFEKLQQLVQ